MRNIAVKFYSANPDKPAGMPDEWPWQCREIGDATEYADEPGPWTIMTLDAFETYREEKRPLYDAWAAMAPTEVT
jgi:hypothetical protein